jgi:hypothetical protein
MVTTSFISSLRVFLYFQNNTAPLALIPASVIAVYSAAAVIIQ